MGEDHRLLYNSVEDAGKIHPNDLNERYCEYAQDPRSDRTVRGYSRKMINYDLLERRGPNRDRRIVVADG